MQSRSTTFSLSNKTRTSNHHSNEQLYSGWCLLLTTALIVSTSLAFAPTYALKRGLGTALSINKNINRRAFRGCKQGNIRMCQLVGMDCATPTDFCFSFRGLRERGGNTDGHKDGWGVAFYEGKGVRTFLDSLPSADSPVANLVANYPIKTLNCIAHIRLATQGEVKLENVHPFTRELWGRYWTFAHNGDIPYFKGEQAKTRAQAVGRSSNIPVGDTDSESFFCYLLNNLAEAFPEGQPSHRQLYSKVLELTRAAVAGANDLTILNFLLTNGDFMFAGCWSGSRPGSRVFNGLHYLVRQPPFAQASLSDCDYTIDFSTVTNPEDRVAVIATAPLTRDECWCQMQRGELYVFQDGRPFSNGEDWAMYAEQGIREYTDFCI